jgi:hypothetical protein
MLEVDVNNQVKWEVKDGQNGQVKIETFTFPQLGRLEEVGTDFK